MSVRSPCVGICSTTYGDLVCRGCKRFAHEISQWNGYDTDQRRAVVNRLDSLLAGAVQQIVQITDRQLLSEAVGSTVADLPEHVQIYQALQLAARRTSSPASVGLYTAPSMSRAADVLKAIDAEMYARSQARYEHDFKVSSI